MNIRKKNILIITLVFMTSFFFITPTNTVMATPQARTIDNWDSYTVGATSGTGAYGGFEREGGSTYDVTDDWSLSGSKSYRNVKPTSDVAYYNITWDFEYVNSVTFWGKSYYNEGVNGDTANHSIYFVNESDVVNSIRFAYYTSGAQCHGSLSVLDFDDTAHALRSWSGNENQILYEYKLIITHVELNTFNYSLYYGAGESPAYYHGVDISGKNPYTHTTYDKIEFHTTGTYNHASSTNTFYIDNIVFTEDELPAPPGSGEEGSIYIKAFDSLSGDKLHMQGSDVNDATKQDRIWPKLESDLWIGEYDPDMSGYTITITGTFNEGSEHTIYFNGFYDNNIVGYLNGVSKNWWEYNATFKWYKETVYSFTLTSTDMGAPGYVYCAPTAWPSQNPCMDEPGKLKMCLEKDTYELGETIKMKFYFPSKAWLGNNGGWIWGDLTEGWRIELWNESDWEYAPSDSWGEGEGYWNAPPHCDWIYFEILCDDLWNFKDEYAKYKFQLVNRDPVWDYTAGEIFFWCTGDTVALEADLLYINPATPMTFQGSTIAWTSNCTVKIEIERLGSGDDPDVYYSDNQPGTAYLNITFWQTGEYLASIYGYDGVGMNPIPLDTLQFDVTGEYNPWPGHEYLEIFGDPYFIAGQPGRNVTINFKTLVNESNLTIVMPNGATSRFSRTVNMSDRSHSFWLDSGAPIGEWTVTLYGQATHINYFHVISEEGNFIKFVKNVYYDDQYFSVILKHTRYVSLTFYKDDVPQGESWLLNIDDHAKELEGIVVPPRYAIPAVGEWRVEMWRLNEENIIKYLAGDNCTVIHRPDPPYTAGDSDLGVLVQEAFPDPAVRTIIGLAICIVITFLPFLTSLKMKKIGVTVNIPTVLYGICFGVGVAVSYMIGFFGVEVMFFITFVLIAIMSLMYLYGKRSASSASEA